MLVIGHRGCNYNAYNQNTLRAYKKVIDEGAKAIEFDVQLSLDKEMLVVHNLNLAKVSTGSGFVREKTSQEIRSLYAGKIENGKDRIPFLSEVFDLCSSYEKQKRPMLHVELKGEETGLAVANLVNNYISKGLLDSENFLISSFNWEELKLVKANSPSIKIALLDGAIRRKGLLEELATRNELFSTVFSYGEENYMIPFSTDFSENQKLIAKSTASQEVQTVLLEEVQKCLSGACYNDSLIENAISMGAYSLNLWYESLSQDFVQKAHAHGLKVFTYTVNKTEDILRLPVLGVDGFFTDYYSDTLEIMKKNNIH